MNNKTNIKSMTKIGLMTAVMCILAPLSIPIGPIPVSLGTFAIYLSLYLTDTKNTFVSCGIYYLLGLGGMPVFSGFAGGISKAAGPTGGFLIGYFFIALIGGIFIESFKGRIMQFIGMLLGTLVMYLIAGLWFSVVMDTGFVEAILACTIPFIFVDPIKMILALGIGRAVRKRTEKIIE